MTDHASREEASLPSLLREARDVYRDAIRQALANCGCDDLPRNGAAVLAGLDPGTPEPDFSPQADVVASLRLSKQAASQLIDTLVLRDYLERRIDPADRRRMEVRLTERGRIAACAIMNAIDAVDTALVQLISTDQLHGLRTGLAAFRQLRQRTGEKDAVARPPVGRAA